MTDKTSSCKQAYVSKTFIITSYGSGKLISNINLSLFPFGVGCHFSFEGTKNPNTKGFFVLNLIIIGPVILKSWEDYWTSQKNSLFFNLLISEKEHFMILLISDFWSLFHCYLPLIYIINSLIYINNSTKIKYKFSAEKQWHEIINKMVYIFF